MEDDKTKTSPNEKKDSTPEDFTESRQEKKTRLSVTALMALAALLLIVLTAAAFFIAIASFLQAQWLYFILALIAIVLLLWLLGRVMRIAVNKQ